MEKQGDLAKLPKWAQTRIEDLERHNMSLQAHIEDLEREAPDSNVKMAYHTHKDYGLPMDSSIDFYMGESRQKFRDMISVQHIRTKDRKVLRVSASDSIVVRPGGGNNVIEVATER